MPTANPKQHTLDLLRAMLGTHADFRPGQWDAIEAVAVHKKSALAFPRPFKEPPVKLPEWMKTNAASLPTEPSQPSLF